jgi:uncharacterized protein YgbK (DUF1537 family)
MRDGSALMGCYGLAGSLHDAVALAGAFGPGSVIGFGASEAGASDILAPAGASLVKSEISAVASLGREQYFLSFGNHAPEGLAPVAGAIEHLAAATGVGFMAVCLAAPEQGRTVYQGHLFEGSRMRADLARNFAMQLDGSVGIVPREIVAAGAAAIGLHCGRLKEQGRVLALIDAIDEDDCASAAAAMRAMPLAGGVAGFAGQGGFFGADDGTGPVAILSGAVDRQTIFQVGAARAAVPVYDLDFSVADPAKVALAWAAMQTPKNFIISSSVPPDKLTANAPATLLFGEIARGLVASGVRRFIVTGGQTGLAVRDALGLKNLRAVSATGTLIWLKHETLAISFKLSGAGGKNLFLSEFEPHLSLNNIAELTS